VKVIVGLGNPGREYALTRHNVGWWVVDHLAAVWGFDRWRHDGDALVATAVQRGTTTRLVKPQTYMNLSGAALRPYLRRATWNPAADLLVIVDDVALPVGRFRLRAAGSSGGHNGLKSIEAALGSREYPRLRVGIKPIAEHHEVGALVDFVLDTFAKDERAAVLALMPALVDAADRFLREGVVAAMNAFNPRGGGASC
jgi:peptidyl-tRNA hydrolase, PTH1 family